MFRIQNLILLLLLTSCSTPKLTQEAFEGERTLAAVPADCGILISKFFGTSRSFDKDSFQRKLATRGYTIMGDALFKDGRPIANVEVISPRYLFEWQDKDYHDAWIANGGILPEDMDDILTERAQSYGRGFYVSLDPFDSQSYGSHLTIFKVDRPLMLIKDVQRTITDNNEALNELRELGFAGIKGTQTWLSMINEDFLSKAVRIDQNAIDYVTTTFNPSTENQLLLYAQLSLAGKKVPVEKFKQVLLKSTSLYSAKNSSPAFIEALRTTTPAQLNQIVKKGNINFFLNLYSEQHSLGKITEEDYKIIIKILSNSPHNGPQDISQDFLKELINRMPRSQFNQIASKSESPFFLQLYSQLMLSGKNISEAEYTNIVSALLAHNSIYEKTLPSEALAKLMRKMDYSQMSLLMQKIDLHYADKIMQEFPHSKSFFALFDVFDVATIGKIDTDEALSLQDMFEYAKKYETATASIKFDKIKSPDDFKITLKKIFELNYKTRSEDVIMTPYLDNKYTITISQNSFDYIKNNKLLNLSQIKNKVNSNVDLMVSYVELSNLPTLKPLFTSAEYKAITSLKRTDEAAALKLMIDTLLIKFFDRSNLSNITTVLFESLNPSPLDLYRAFVSLHPFEDGNGRAARLYYNWLQSNMNDSTGNLLNEADILIPATHDYVTRSSITKSRMASKFWILSSGSEEEMIERANFILKNDPNFIEILKDLPYLKNRL